LSTSIDRPCHLAIMRDILARTAGRPRQWVALQGTFERLAQSDEVAFRQALDLARTKGLVVVEETPGTASLTDAGRALFHQSDEGSASPHVAR
jgi:hypothetical protein